ncbi:MAG: hypothetical protein K0S08_665 [Gammaproteobacteria bacterium]|jgi:hypothetical protein|nr:hypothetical protein [Gammaproteobacteria bacterium]
MSWQQLREFLAKQASKLVKDVLFQKNLANRYLNHGFPKYEGYSRAEGMAKWRRHVHRAALHPFTPAATRLNMVRINTPIPFLDYFPEIYGLELTAFLDAYLDLEKYNPIRKKWQNRENKEYRRRQCFMGIHTDMTVSRNDLLGSDDPSRTPGQALAYWSREHYLHAAQEAKYDAEREAAQLGDDILWLNAFGNVALLSFFHNLYYSNERELILKIGGQEFRTGRFLAYITFKDFVINTKKNFIRLDLDELVVGLPVWFVPSEHLIPFAFKLTGSIMLDRDRVTYDLKYKLFAEDDSHYRPVNFKGLPNEYKWEVADKREAMSAVDNNLMLFLKNSLSQLLVGAINCKHPEMVPVSSHGLKIVELKQEESYIPSKFFNIGKKPQADNDKKFKDKHFVSDFKPSP